MRRPALSYANVTATLALFIALGGTSWAVTQLPRNSVGSAQVRDGSLTKADLAKGLAQPGRDGRDGARGPRGAEGPAGKDGAPGATGSLPAAEAWKPMDLRNGWTDLGGGHETAQYRKDQLGVVHVKGVVKLADDTPHGMVMAMMPPGYRPARVRIFDVSAGAPVSSARVDFHFNGEVGWAAGPSGEPDYTSLDGISFVAEQ